jgi:hypothetical protein
VFPFHSQKVPFAEGWGVLMPETIKGCRWWRNRDFKVMPQFAGATRVKDVKLLSIPILL